MPASPLEPGLGMVVTEGIDTVDKGFFSYNKDIIIYYFLVFIEYEKIAYKYLVKT